MITSMHCSVEVNIFKQYLCMQSESLGITKFFCHKVYRKKRKLKFKSHFPELRDPLQKKIPI
ncbi:hypothetical protein BLOT_001098 [Blomia tropicalis]|nr:hypothetical protein BLOT_001098 [Blomia tropicalis]